ncbi:hypothetical protein [Laspinema olomoucense]|uniref:hypothetical protein n=1 Tax=Laspinema olomoucense TaxID=3231600 RepID=UPI0021BAFA83|nr:hypothetical protein [Laspinema sp. D3d]
MPYSELNTDSRSPPSQVSNIFQGTNLVLRMHHCLSANCVPPAEFLTEGSKAKVSLKLATFA